MTDDHYELSLAVFDAGEARDKLRAATTVILNLERGYANAIPDAADAEAAYRLEDARDTRRSLWRLIEWSRERDIAKIKVGQQMAMAENAPADRWP
jgi:hypothetical protein